MTDATKFLFRDLAAVSAVLCIIYFFILGAAAVRRRTYSGRLFCLSPLSLRSHQ